MRTMRINDEVCSQSQPTDVVLLKRRVNNVVLLSSPKKWATNEVLGTTSVVLSVGSVIIAHCHSDDRQSDNGQCDHHTVAVMNSV